MEEKNNSSENKENTNKEDENQDLNKENIEKENKKENKKEESNKMDIEKDKIKIEDDEKNENDKKEEENKERSIYSLKGAKKPLSIYTRRVMDISKINDYLNEDSTKGRCGGHNLGNTCFMNSSIACISNCTELTYYFLKGDYLKDINTENSLGLQGELAKSWGNLLQEYWVKDTRVGDPSDFKSTIGQKAHQFRGFRQHDSNEFMSIFLDYLNEDLNRVTKKEYIEMKEKQEGETDEQCAKRFWDCNLRRNDSIITDLFCGQFKSTITCPNCGNINITFDPFDTINLPMINRNKNKKDILKEYKFFYVPIYNIRNMICLKIKNINEGVYMENIINRIKKENNFVYHNKIDNLLIGDIYNKKLFKFIQKAEKIEDYNLDNENVFSYDIMNKGDDLRIPIYFLKNRDNDSQSQYPRIIFCKDGATLDDLRKKIYFNLRKYILSPLIKEKEEKDSLTLEIEKYINDEKLELDDEKLFELINKEYQQIFKINEDEEEEEENGKNEKEKDEKTDNEMKEENDDKYIKKFREDMPFTIYLENSIIIDGKYFRKLSPELKKLLEVNSYGDSIKELSNRIDNCKIFVEFNEKSKYINKDKFDLDFCKIIELEYEIKKEEEKKKENEEEDDGKLTLEKCLKKFCKEEQLEEGDEWYCSKCKNHVLAKKKMDFYYLPKILIICFKRFTKESYRWEKNEDNVDFPINDLDMKDLMIGPDKEHSVYDLFAVSQHYGSTGFGHYTAVCKNNGEWFSYDDSSCSGTSPESCLTSAAYVLFYRRKTD